MKGKDILRWIFNRLPVRTQNIYFGVMDWWGKKIIIDWNVVKEIAEYANQSEKEVLQLMKQAAVLEVKYWKDENPKTKEEILKWYKKNPYKIYRLAYWHMSRGQRNFRKYLVKRGFGKVLDYGGGIGDLSIELARKGLDVTYGDVADKLMDFVRWRLKKRNLNIKILDSEKNEDRLENYDIIYCIDVIEHVPNKEEVLDRICNHINLSGLLIITGLVFDVDELHPMHLNIKFDYKKIMKKYSMEEIEPNIYKKVR